MTQRSLTIALFPYTTLFRSVDPRLRPGFCPTPRISLDLSGSRRTVGVQRRAERAKRAARANATAARPLQRHVGRRCAYTHSPLQDSELTNSNPAASKNRAKSRRGYARPLEKRAGWQR